MIVCIASSCDEYILWAYDVEKGIKTCPRKIPEEDVATFRKCSDTHREE
jgi:hypothetical protein